MLDTYGLANMIYDVIAKRKERFEASAPFITSTSTFPTSSTLSKDTNTTWNIISITISILVGSFALYLSWSCNTALGYHVILKILFGFFAFLFGLVYIVLYIILRIDTCAKIMHKF